MESDERRQRAIAWAATHPTDSFVDDGEHGRRLIADDGYLLDRSDWSNQPPQDPPTPTGDRDNTSKGQAMTDYAAPSSGGDNLPLAELLGSLLRIEVTEALTDVQTSFGPANPVRANVAVLDGDNKAAEYDDALIFPRVLVSQLKPNVGKVVLGRLGKGTAKPGQSAPWTLGAPTDADIETAKKYDAYKATQKVDTSAPF